MLDSSQFIRADALLQVSRLRCTLLDQLCGIEVWPGEACEHFSNSGGGHGHALLPSRAASPCILIFNLRAPSVPCAAAALPATLSPG